MDAESTIKDELRVELGPGEYPEYPNYIRVDWDPEYDPDYICDIGSEKLPFQDDSVIHLYAKYVLEHLSSEELIHLLWETHRVLRIDGTAEFIVPEYRNPRAIDIFHKTYYTIESFRYFDVEKKDHFTSLRRIGPFPLFYVDVIRLPDPKYTAHNIIKYTLKPFKESEK